MRKPINTTRPLLKSGVSQKIKSILVPVDFSGPSKAALRQAVELTAQHRASLTVIHVVGAPQIFGDATVSPYVEWNEQYLASAKSHLAKLVAAEVPKTTKAKALVITGKAWNEIVRTAKENKADLIVMGTHGLTGIKHIFLGSTAEKVVRHATCSVLVVHETRKRKTTGGQFKKILAPVDFSDCSKMAVNAAANWARRSGATVQLLYVVPFHYGTDEYSAIDYRLLHEEQEESGRRQLAEWVKTFPEKSVKVKAFLTRGRPATEITEFAKKAGIDLIVISTHGLTRFKHVLLGSTTEEVVRYNGCPVLVVREARMT